ncbi:alanine--tRNA ligase-related protein, partial [candidate division KSB1 bacterium]
VSTKFDYILEELSTTVAAITDDNGNDLDSASEGTEVNIQLKEITPFYPEAGGQIGDTGTFSRKDGTVIAEVLDTQKAGEDIILHRAKIISGTLKTGEQILASVDKERRLDIRRNHTATHLMHKALREVLGTHVQQAGSLVSPDYLRFDFNHFQKMTDEEVEKVEIIVNEMIRKNTAVAPHDNIPFNEAKERGAVALFGEKYGDRVRMIQIGDFSLELCGGTHIDYIGNIGEFRIVSESAVSAGVRRIVAETGKKAQLRTGEERSVLTDLKVGYPGISRQNRESDRGKKEP